MIKLNTTETAFSDLSSSHEELWTQWIRLLKGAIADKMSKTLLFDEKWTLGGMWIHTSPSGFSS